VNDAGADATTSEEDAEAGGGVTGGPEAGGGPEGGSADAPSEAAPSCTVTVPSVANFYTTLVADHCSTVASCCAPSYTGTTIFNNAQCLSIFSNFPGFLGVLQAAAYINGGRMQYNTTAACSCLEDNLALACGTIPATSADAGLVPLQYLCNGVFQGTAGIGDACASSYECAQGEYCSVELASDPTDDAGLGACAALLTQGETCTSNTQCSYAGLGQPSLYCDTANTGECQPRLAAGVTCTTDDQCVSTLCAGSCLSGEAVSSSFLCGYLSEDGGI
jgi:hypothetical protein